MVMKKNVKLLGMVAMFSVTLASCTNDELKEVYQGEEISFTTRMTRAVETNSGNLEKFKVYANGFGIDGLFIDGAIAERASAGSSIYNTEQSYFWPDGVKSMKFWAYAPTDVIDEKNVKIVWDSQVFNDFQPATDMSQQKDFIVAYSNINHDDAKGMTVDLKFHHALSQIEVKANCPSTDKRVYIAGAWIVNVNGKGTLTFDDSQVQNNYMSWTSQEPTTYGKSFSGAQITSQGTDLLTNSNSRNLMLVPQEVSKYNFEIPNSGAYILLLCRVEAWHNGSIHQGESIGDLIDTSSQPGKHIHQLFPITETYNPNAYGYTCVPVDFDWKPGTKYIYNLEFCGHGSGAGVYPPKDFEKNIDNLPTGDNYITDIPSGKQPGNPVLDNPISFKVTIESWTPENSDDAVTDTPMN